MWGDACIGAWLGLHQGRWEGLTQLGRSSRLSALDLSVLTVRRAPRGSLDPKEEAVSASGGGSLSLFLSCSTKDPVTHFQSLGSRVLTPNSSYHFSDICTYTDVHGILRLKWPLVLLPCPGIFLYTGMLIETLLVESTQTSVTHSLPLCPPPSP